MDSKERNIFQMADEFEQENPGVVKMMQLLGVGMEVYETSLSALYTPKIVTSSSTEDLYANME